MRKADQTRSPWVCLCDSLHYCLFFSVVLDADLRSVSLFMFSLDWRALELYDMIVTQLSFGFFFASEQKQ